MGPRGKGSGPGSTRPTPASCPALGAPTAAEMMPPSLALSRSETGRGKGAQGSQPRQEGLVAGGSGTGTWRGTGMARGEAG